MAISFSGIGSGFNTDTIVAKLVEAEKLPLANLQKRQSEATNQQATWRSLNTRLLALDSQASKLEDSSTFKSRGIANSDDAVLAATASPGEDLGNFKVEVVNLARQHQVVSSGYATKDAAVGSGTVTLSMGPAGYAPIEFTGGTLEGLRDAINTANLPIKASLVDSGEAAGASRYRLMLNSGTTGSAGHMQVNLNLSGGTSPTFTDLQTDQDAHVKLGTLDVYSSSNTVSDMIPGVTLKLKKAGTVELAVTRDTSAVKAAINNLMEQSNQMTDFFKEQFAYDSETGKTGTLFGDSTLVNIQSDLFSSLTNRRSIEGSSLSSLSSIGIGLDAGGHLAVTDQAAYDKAMTNPAEVAKLFTDKDHGIATGLRKQLDKFTAARTGLITLEDKRLTEQQTDLENRVKAVNDKATRTESRLKLLYLGLESSLSKLKNQSSALSAQLGSVSSNSSSSSKSS